LQKSHVGQAKSLTLSGSTGFGGLQTRPTNKYLT
jgi:hypothetical protein